MSMPLTAVIERTECASDAGEVPPERAEVTELLALAIVKGDDVPAAAPANVLSLPRLDRELTPIEHYVLARVAVHTWNFNGQIPYRAPNRHQFAVALNLAAPDVRLLAASPWERGSYRRVTFRLSGFGERTVRWLFRLVPADDDQARAVAFDKMRALMRNEPEVGA